MSAMRQHKGVTFGGVATDVGGFVFPPREIMEYLEMARMFSGLD